MTPLLYACSTGLADVVKELAERLADMNVVDDNGRGCIQLASKTQGNNQMLATWLRRNTDAPETSGKGRPRSEKQKGRLSSAYRWKLGPKADSILTRSYKPQEQGRNGAQDCYQPQESQAKRCRYE